MAVLAPNETSRSGVDIVFLQPRTFELTPKEKEWSESIYSTLAVARVETLGRGFPFNPAVAIPSVVAKYQDLLDTPIEISPEGSMRGGISDGGHLVAAVRLKTTEFHDHLFTESYQVPLHVEGGVASAIAVENGQLAYEDVVLGKVYNNKPGTSHAFVLKHSDGRTVQGPDEGVEIWFLAFTGRNLAEDTYNVTQNDAERYFEAVRENPQPIHARPAVAQQARAG